MMTTTGHKRPGLNPGLPLAQAESKAQEIHAAIQSLLVPATPTSPQPKKS